ncbi:GrdX family protein [Proteinivorax hydrogeniformans]|uniref:GrdX family protein n=1 Tax=Proteinivorax hydrogeniformans TaxID=1826727 RepID=A0AAU8HTK9_9FIRM
MEKIIITNNDMVKDFFNKECDKEYMHLLWAESLPKVLQISRDKIHVGYKLVNHPLASSIKPYRNLFKTVVVCKHDAKLDFFSLTVLEDAIVKAKDFDKDVFITPQIEEDYKLIDLEMFKGCLK